MYRFKIEDETFDEVRDSLNGMLQNTVTTMMDKKNAEGSVTLKLSISLENDRIVDPNTGAIRDVVVPTFSHTVSNVVQTKNSIGGQINMERELVWDANSHTWAMRDIGVEQMGFDED